MKLLFVSLGCDKNLVDTEFMLGMLRDDGIEITNDETEADIIIVNTCCFINDAKEESVNAILEMAEYKKIGPLKALIVTGCLAQRYKEEIKTEIPEVDAILGTNSYEDIVKAVHEALGGTFYENFKTLEGLPSIHTKRSVTTGGHFAYLKIAEGCNKRCTYCIIPYIRGNYRSVPMERLIKEAQELADSAQIEQVLADAGISGADIDELMAAKDASGALLGYVITVTDHEGYGGDIQFSMGITNEGTLNGISLLSISETAGLGMRAGEVLVPQFSDKNVSRFTYTKTGATADSEIDAISGATITTNAVVNGVNAGLAYFDKILKGGSAQ